MLKVDYIRRDVPAEISEAGGAYIQLVGKSTVGLRDSIKEAIAHLFCVGEPSMIEGYFVGIMRSVFEGIRNDGHPRSVGDIQFYPVCGGTFDLDRGWDPLVNDVRVKARIVNGVTLDVGEWTFRDATLGRVPFRIEKLGNGLSAGIVSNDRDVEVNGCDFPEKAMLRVSWRCGTRGGEVAAAKYARTVSRLTIDKSVLATLTAAEDGEPFEVTVKGCYNKASKAAAFRYVAPPPTPTTVTKVTQEGRPDDTARLAAVSPCVIHGTGLTLGADDKVLIELWRDGTCLDEGDLSAHDKVVSSGDTEISLSGFQWNNRSVPDGEWWDAYPDTKIVVVKNNVRYEHPMTFKGE